MTRWQLERRMRARLQGERGFTLVETVIAIVMIFGSLTALAYTATIGFGYGNLAKQKQAATGIANQLMEEIRGLAYDTVAKGLLTSNVPGGDANIVACESPTVYRYLSCAAGSAPGSGEKIVNSSSAANPTVPLVPHQGTITGNSVAFSWSTYVSNDCPVVDAANGCPAVNPFRVTVLVTWTGGASAPNKLVSIQSLLFSPGGCRSTATHPYAAPCQPFFFGEATVPQSQITIDAVGAGLPGTTFVTGSLLAGTLEADAQQEQLSQVQGGYAPVGVQLTDGSGTQTAGGASETTTAADSDPGSASVSTYATKTLTPPASSTTITTPSSGNTHIDFSSPAGDTATSSSTTSAGGSNVCPPPTDTAETDLKPCGGGRQQQGGTLSASFTANNLSQPLGSTTLAQVGVAANLPNKVFENRVVNPTTGAICTSPLANTDGCLEQTATRRFGTIGIGGLPSSMTAPGGWNGFFFSITGYQDQCQAAVGNQSGLSGTVVPAPTATVSAGTVSYWNGSSYTTVSATDASLNSLNASATFSSSNGGHTTQVVIATVPTGMSAATTSTTSTSGAPPLPSLTSAQALVSPPQAAISFTVTIDGTTVVQLQITVNLKQLEARGVYGPAPGQGT